MGVTPAHGAEASLGQLWEEDLEWGLCYRDFPTCYCASVPFPVLDDELLIMFPNVYIKWSSYKKSKCAKDVCSLHKFRGHYPYFKILCRTTQAILNIKLLKMQQDKL